MLLEVMVLLVVYQLKHFFADYIFQGKYMLGKFKEKDWVLPLSAHVSVHGFMTLCIAMGATGMLWVAVLLAILDMAIHFIMDRIKASPKALGRFNIQQKEFWWSLGLDQMVHHLTHYGIIAIIILV